MAKENPTVSVCIPTYNRAEMLREAISSVLGQSFNDFELIISDNASEDGTEAIVKSFRDKRISYARNKTNIGLIRNVNQCLQLANGLYVTIFHDDDIMLPNNLEDKVRALEDNPKVGFVHSKFHVIDEHGTIIEASKNLGSRQEHDFVERGLSFVARTVMTRNVVNPASVLMRRECYERVGGFSEGLLYTADYEYWMRIALYYDVMFLARALVCYRKHAGWGTSRFMTSHGGKVVVSLDGLLEYMRAKLETLERSKHIMENWGNVRQGVKKDMAKRFVQLLDNNMLVRGDRRGVRKAIVCMCRLSPGLAIEREVLKLALKSVLSRRAIEALKGIGLR